ncbi:hypothetical protein BC939DRAFT_110147 [Gamsiella multidivaricata]|uniref:uncharacterized protein n=1 Tax=Gamsiella multidivaricata TaxID=101098 RepID=UPI002220387D|nr:uncharacterized protein BC939DRAFT_110147 [Gamsiella multidivaricata]KAI7826994.1 hypothetical protein BC939DRAFT_110147 [Gamsiella multidivaricata]
MVMLLEWQQGMCLIFSFFLLILSPLWYSVPVHCDCALPLEYFGRVGARVKGAFFSPIYKNGLYYLLYVSCDDLRTWTSINIDTPKDNHPSNMTEPTIGGSTFNHLIVSMVVSEYGLTLQDQSSTRHPIWNCMRGPWY